MTATLEERVSGGNGHDHGPKKLPESAVKYFAKKKLVDKLVNTTRSIHNQVYMDMENNLLLDDKGRPNYSKLDEPETQKKALDMLLEGYKKHADRVGASIKKGLDEEEVDIVLNKYFGVTKDSLRIRLKEHGKKYDSKTHETERDEHLKHITAEMHPVTVGHFSKDEIDEIFKYIGESIDEMISKGDVKKNPAVLGTFLELNKQNKGKGLPYQVLTQSKELSPYLNREYSEKEFPTTNEEVEKIQKEHARHAHGHGHHAPAAHHS